MFKTMKKCTVDDINDKLDYLKRYKKIILNREPEPNEIIGSFKAFLFKKISTVHLIYKDVKGNGHVIQYSARLDREFDGNDKNGAQALAILQKYYKAPEVNDKNNAPFSIGIAPYRNSKFVGKRTPNCYGYDLNSAYPYGMLQDIPDTTQPLQPGKVKEDEYSFTLTGLRAKPGTYSIFRFKAMKSPYVDFVNNWYARKKNAANDAEKNIAKFVMNASIGALQNHNCYIRAAVINNFHSFILEIFNKYKDHILSMNVDSIVSDIPIPEIEANIGPEIGQWKLEHYGDFAIHSNKYSVQWNREIPAFGAGIPKAWFTEGYDLLVDGIPMPKNIYDIDTEKQVIYKQEA